MKLTVPAPTAGIIHRPDHATQAIEHADQELAEIDRLIGPPPPE